jgi:hypothetical protein
MLVMTERLFLVPVAAIVPSAMIGRQRDRLRGEKNRFPPGSVPSPAATP